MRLLFRAHAVGFSLVGLVQPCLLRNVAAGFDDADLTFDLVFESLADEAEGVHILDLGLGSQLLFPSWAHTDVGIASQRAFLHIAIADAGVQDDFLKTGEVLVGFLGGGDLRLAHNLDERYPAAVEVDGGGAAAIGKALVQAFTRIFFQVQAYDANLFLPAGTADPDPAKLGQRLVVLGDLVSLGQIGIEIVFAGENRSAVDAAIQR